MNIKKYDNVIIGGGISGLYLAYRLSKKFPEKTIAIIEKNKTLGGRIYTVRKTIKELGNLKIKYEAGAGRFSNEHHILIKLLKELDFTDKDIYPINSEYIHINTIGKRFVNPKTNQIENMTFDKMTEVLDFIITKYGNTAKNDITFREFLLKYLPEDTVNLIQATFGYDSEYIKGSATAIVYSLKKEKYYNQTYNVLTPGLSSIIKRLIAKLNNKVDFYTNTKVFAGDQQKGHIYAKLNFKDVQFLGQNIFVCTGLRDTQKMFGSFLEKIVSTNLAELVEPISLNRTFIIYRKDVIQPFYNSISGGKIPVISTNLPIRMIIPYGSFKNENGEEYMMFMFYNDLTNADKSYELFKNNRPEFEQYIEDNLNQLLKKEGKEPLKLPIAHIRVEYWKDGVHLWKPNKLFQSPKYFIEFNDNLYKNGIKYSGDPQIYFCNEAYSVVQEWMESSLENVDKLINTSKSDGNNYIVIGALAVGILALSHLNK